ncbi:hypothetical protein D3C81_1788160 [compost metagenome]
MRINLGLQSRQHRLLPGGSGLVQFLEGRLQIVEHLIIDPAYIRYLIPAFNVHPDLQIIQAGLGHHPS